MITTDDNINKNYRTSTQSTRGSVRSNKTSSSTTCLSGDIHFNSYEGYLLQRRTNNPLTIIERATEQKKYACLQCYRNT